MNNLKSKKIVATTLTFVLVMALAGPPLPAKERRGSTVVVILTSGRSVEGELLAVKGHDLIIHDKFKDQGFMVNIEQVPNIWIKKKSRFISGLALGLAAGVGLGAILYACTSERDGSLRGFALMVPSSVTIPIGGMIGALQGLSKKITIQGEEQNYIEECLQYLQQHARY